METGHSESVYIEVDQAGVTVEQMKELLSNAPGVVLEDDPSNKFIQCQQML